jgi:hypothetical protein
MITCIAVIVQSYLLPSVPPANLIDQYAYRLSGSTTAALVNVLLNVTGMLEFNQFVCCSFIDFSKAFDTVNHPILFSKLKQFSLPPAILAWIVNFLTSRTLAVTRAGSICSLLHITRSIIQGSGLGPALYIIYKSDMRTLSALNKLCKFADDTTLLAPQSTDVQIIDEF